MFHDNPIDKCEAFEAEKAEIDGILKDIFVSMHDDKNFSEILEQSCHYADHSLSNCNRHVNKITGKNMSRKVVISFIASQTIAYMIQKGLIFRMKMKKDV